MRKTIASRLILSVAVTLVLVLGGAAFLGLRTLEELALQQAVEGGERLATTIKRSLRYAMLHDDREGVRNTVRAVGVGEAPLDLRVFNKDGRVMFASQPGQLNHTVSTDADACKGCHHGARAEGVMDPRLRTNVYVDDLGARRLQRIEPVYNESDCSSAPCHVHAPEQKVLGVMDIAISLAPFDARMAESRNTAIGASIAIIALISLIILLLMRRFVTRRIATLVVGTRVISDGNLDHRIPAMGPDEFGQLATSFNGMTEKLQETRGRLLHTEKLASLGRLSAGIAHEINNPLTGVLLHASSMLEQMPADDPRRESLDLIVSETKRCRDVIKGLLDFSRQSRPNKALASVRELADRVLSVLGKQATARGIRLTASGEPVPDVNMDSAQMLQVLLNLVLNAMDAMPLGGPLNLTWRRVDGLVEIDVVDAGGGIPADQLARIFEPFFTTKENGRGTGLGLAVSWGIVEQHGGTIRVRSEVGRGSTFTVSLPLGQA